MTASFIFFPPKMCLGLQLYISIFLDQTLYFYNLFLDSSVVMLYLFSVGFPWLEVLGLAHDIREDTAAATWEQRAVLSLSLGFVIIVTEVKLRQLFSVEFFLAFFCFVFWFFEIGFFCSFGACPGTLSVDQAGLKFRDPPASTSSVQD